MTKSRIIGVLIGIIGVIIVIGYENISGFLNNDIGKVLILLSGLSYAFAAIFAKMRLQNVKPEVAATGMLTMSTLILSPFILLFYGNEILSLNLISISYSLLFAVICSVLAYFIYFKILVSTGAGNPINITNGALNYSATHTSFLIEHEFILTNTLFSWQIKIYIVIIVQTRLNGFKISLIRSSINKPLSWIAWAYALYFSGRGPCVSDLIISENPIMEFKGVRNSCEI